MNQYRLNKCPVCKELIGDNEQSINVAYGFGDAMPIMYSLLFHYKCVEGLDCVRYMMDYYEMEEL
tara:strand:- start:1281 stop:1475 length:195 start_codon:yes stop_codon:yes gene_type:complete